jgi:hypothetical protein
LTENDKFELTNLSIAVTRLKDKSAVCFGEGEFRINDSSNIKDCFSRINRGAYFNNKYKNWYDQ